MVMTETDKNYIRQTFELALRARGMVSPNPLVGCVVVKDGKVIGEGYHRGPGQMHAEPDALKNLSAIEVAGSTLYCNLEPCCHTNKRTPACTNLLLDKRPARVVIANLDPNPEVSGKGVAILRNAGIKVDTGVLEKEGAELNESFFKYITTQKPFIHLKIAQTLDGRMSSATGSSQWITDEKARSIVHQWRNDYDAVLIGAGTLRADNPSLTPRDAWLVNKPCPKRIVVTGAQREFNHDLNLLSDEFSAQTIFMSGEDLPTLVRELGASGITSILVEAGPKLSSSFLNAGLVDRLSVFIAPKFLGNGPAFFSNDLNLKMSEAIIMKDVQIHTVGSQVLMTGRP